MPRVRIRPAASSADVDVVRTLFSEYAAGVGVDLGFQGFTAELDSLPGSYAPPAGTLLLAERGNDIIGCLGVRPLDPPLVAELKRLYVRPPGRGTGVGRSLTEAALTFARAAGYERVRLDTLPGMTEARRLYAQLGFRKIPPYRHNPVPGTTFLQLTLAGPDSLRTAP